MQPRFRSMQRKSPQLLKHALKKQCMLQACPDIFLGAKENVEVMDTSQWGVTTNNDNRNSSDDDNNNKDASEINQDSDKKNY
ncbi:hypothetical protein K432DRAFT_81513 [Lepidopterella palustris CBS 459.81]|uniref:Uncharacterized protein n=1 Tax=Lepidopterella palustris CBS 459.81 TaxID=1314670 RepID=A0A8E2JE09_9PEZI|nr:hypothetical protein K432DRAFT_81513 [Lepidopterella palustris CBS 459.81]